MKSSHISVKYFSQEDLLNSGCFDVNEAIDVIEKSIVGFMNKRVLMPDKTVQIFDDVTQDRINVLPATLLDEKICGVKWVSVFPNNPKKFAKQNVSAVIILSEIVSGFPIALMEGTFVSNLRTAAISAIAAKYLAKQCSETIGFIGAGENAKMNLMAMKTVRPSLRICKVSSRTIDTEKKFVEDMSKVLPDMKFVLCETNYQNAIEESDIIVTATSTQIDLLKADWVKQGAFYSHIGGWEDEYKVVQKADKIVCDDWESVKHRGQTVSRMYQEGLLLDSDIYADLGEIITEQKKGRETDDEFIYFNTVGLSYADVALAYHMYNRSIKTENGTNLTLQEKRIFDHVIC